MAASPLDDVTNTVKELAYVTVGLGLLAFQRLQVRRNELSKSLGSAGGEARGAVEAVANIVEQQVEVVRDTIAGRISGR